MKRSPRRASPEDALQIAVVRLLDMQRIEGLWWSAVNPKSHKTRAVAIASKAMGMKAGVPDLFFVFQGTPFAIELKADNGRVSDAQQGMAKQMERAGCLVHVARTVEGVIGILAAYGVPINARVAA